MPEPTVCPVCKQPLKDIEEREGVRLFFCDCAGFRRSVVEIHLPVEVKSKSTKKEV